MTGVTVISYSYTGNNTKLAELISKELNAKHIKITEPKKRNYFTITVDLLFSRVPKIEFDPKSIDLNSRIIFISPVWMGKVAFPLRKCFDELKGKLNSYYFVSLSGGGEGINSNPSLEKELIKRLGKKSEVLFNPHIEDLLGSKEKPTLEDIGKYKVTQKDIKNITKEFISLF